MRTELASQPKWRQHLDVLTAEVALGGGADSARAAALSAVIEQLNVIDEEIVTHNAELTATREALDRERARYQELFELTPDPYLLTDRHGVICEANGAAATLFRLNRKFLHGKPLQVFVPERERYQFRIRMVDVLASDSRTKWRLRLVPRTSTPIDVTVSVDAIRDRCGRASGLRWSIRDITERVRSETRLHDLNAEIERGVVKRTEALEAAYDAQEERLQSERCARHIAEAANRSKDDFLATVSHELRTPLNVVLGLVFRIQTESLSSGQRTKAMATIERNARELARLVEDLLDTARIINGRLALDLHLLELAPIVRTAIELLDPSVEACGVNVTAMLQDGVYVNGDSERLRQVTGNLLANALKFTPKGGAIMVRVANDGGYATLDVSDTGSGIDPLVLPHIFERFWQADPSTTRSRSGLGLGLAIVKHLVESHGGRISAASEGQGRGAAFTVELPIADAATLVAEAVGD